MTEQDIVERLRERADRFQGQTLLRAHAHILREAADTIRQLRGERDAMQDIAERLGDLADKLVGYMGLIEEGAALRAAADKITQERDAMQRRAEAAEEDWQLAEAKRDALAREVERLRELVQGALDHPDGLPYGWAEDARAFLAATQPREEER